MTSSLSGITGKDIKNINRKRVFSLLRSTGGMTRREIADQLNLSRGTVTKNIEEMLQDNLIVISGKGGYTGGRSGDLYVINSNCHNAVGLSVTQHHISGVLVNLDGTVLARTRFRYDFALTDSYMNKLGEVVSNLIAESSVSPETVKNVSIALPALISQDGRYAYYSHVIQDLPDNTEITQFTKYIPYEAAFTHDTVAAAYAEDWTNPDLSTFFYMMLSDSTGGAMIRDHTLYYGMNKRSCEIAHMKLISNGRKCFCGKRGCMDPYCSARALTKYTRGNLARFFELLEDGNTNCQNMWDQYLTYLAMSINNIRMLYDCDIIIGGYIGERIDPYIDELKKRAIELDPFSHNADYIIPCQCKADASAYGAALACINSFVATI